MGLGSELIFNLTVTLDHKTQQIMNSGIDRIRMRSNNKMICYDFLPEKSMKNTVNMLRFSLKQSLLGNFNMTILISLLAFSSFKISVNEYITSVVPQNSRENLHWIRC